MRILYVAHRIPYPPNKGDKIRSFNQIKFLGRRHEVHLACLADDPADLAYQSELQAYCQTATVVYLDRRRARLRSLCYLPTTRPLTLPYFHVPALRRAIMQLCRTQAFDLIFVFSSSMAQYVLDIPGAAKILDMVDVDSDKWRQYALYARGPRAYLYGLEWKRMRAYERDITRRFDHTLVIAQPEIPVLRAGNPQAPISVVPNGIDLEWFSQSGPWPVTPELLAAQPYIVFTGAMDYLANVDGILFFAKEIWPQVRQRIPSLRFYVVGMNPTAEIRALGVRDPNIIVTGWVPDTRPYLAHATACVVPLRIARGVQNKILEAMAAGTPVVATARALEGLLVEKDRDVLLADASASFAEALVSVLQHPERYRPMTENARRVLSDQYSWNRCLALLETVLCTEYQNFQRKQAGAPACAVKLG